MQFIKKGNDMEVKKIILTGTHHSGKSTLVQKYKEFQDINVMDELVRALATQANFHFTPDKPTNYAFSELALVHFYYGMAKGFDLLQDDKLWLFDRCIIDPLYYINYFNTDLPLKKGTLYSHAMYMTTDLICEGYFDDSLILLLKPIPIVADDGFRLGVKEQEGVYVKAKEILNSLGVKYEEVSSDEASKLVDSVYFHRK
jgi:nicotinamide riboside kinase